MSLINWVSVEGKTISLDHLQMFEWHDGRLFLYILGRSVPEIIDDPRRVLHSNLIKIVEKRVAK